MGKLFLIMMLVGIAVLIGIAAFIILMLTIFEPTLLEASAPAA